jgi:hypothetical protein
MQTTQRRKATIKIDQPDPRRFFQPQLSKDTLWRSLTERIAIVLVDSATGIAHSGIVNNVGVEDGSGSSFLVTLQCGTVVYHRSRD